MCKEWETLIWQIYSQFICQSEMAGPCQEEQWKVNIASNRSGLHAVDSAGPVLISGERMIKSSFRNQRANLLLLIYVDPTPLPLPIPPPFPHVSANSVPVFISISDSYWVDGIERARLVEAHCSLHDSKWRTSTALNCVRAFKQLVML